MGHPVSMIDDVYIMRPIEHYRSGGLGMIIDRNENKNVDIKQPFIIERILKLLEIYEKVNSKSTPVTNPLLHKDKNVDLRVLIYSYNYGNEEKIRFILEYIHTSLFAEPRACQFCDHCLPTYGPGPLAL